MVGIFLKGQIAVTSAHSFTRASHDSIYFVQYFISFIGRVSSASLCTCMVSQGKYRKVEKGDKIKNWDFAIFAIERIVTSTSSNLSSNLVLQMICSKQHLAQADDAFEYYILVWTWS